MNLKIDDSEQHVLKYFADIRQVITENGLKDLLKPDAEKIIEMDVSCVVETTKLVSMSQN